jgi:exonuclease SbcC
VAEAEAAQVVVEASRPGYEAYREAQVALAALENDRGRRDKLRADHASLEKSLAPTHERVKRLEQELVEIEEAEVHMQRLRPEVERQEESEAALERARGQIRSLELAENSLAGRQRGLGDLQVRLERVQAGLAEVVPLEAALRDHRAQLEQAGEHLADLRSDQVAVKTEMERLAEQTQVLQASAESPEDQAVPCPVCEQPLTAEHRADLLERNRGQLDELEARDRSLAEDISKMKEKVSLLERELRELEAQLRGLPRAAEAEELAAQIAALESELSKLQAEIDSLSGSRDEASRLEEMLAGLGDPRRVYERLAERAEGRPELEEKLEGERHAVSALEASLVEVERALAGFADLGGRLAETRGILDRYEKDYQGYLENTKITADLPARRGQAEALRAQQAGLAAERDAARAQAEEIARRFDPEALDAARRREAGLLAERAGLEGQAQGLRGQVAQAAREIDELEAAERALVAQQAEQARDQGLLSLTGFIRDVIRQAGPHVTRRLMQQVSLEAARLFAEVMADHTARLRWDDNYEIVLEQNGRDRGFPQLSGGEQMAAALAVRLALLRELSAIDIAFFDEPTSNLDDTRRDSLAEQILSVKGFSQLFVISHDDTFERVTHHVVRVRKEDGASRVEAQ